MRRSDENIDGIVMVGEQKRDLCLNDNCNNMDLVDLDVWISFIDIQNKAETEEYLHRMLSYRRKMKSGNDFSISYEATRKPSLNNLTIFFMVSGKPESLCREYTGDETVGDWYRNSAELYKRRIGFLTQGRVLPERALLMAHVLTLSLPLAVVIITDSLYVFLHDKHLPGYSASFLLTAFFGVALTYHEYASIRFGEFLDEDLAWRVLRVICWECYPVLYGDGSLPVSIL